jgi:hypothetical protein
MSDEASEDLLLRKLGNLARFDERWDRLSAGTLTEEEAAELRALAASSAAAREAYEAFRPLGPEFQAAVVARARAAAAAGPATVVPFRRRARRLAMLGAVAAAAAAIVLLARLPSPLPGYSLAQIGGGARPTRGEAAAGTEWAPGDRFQATLRPETEVDRPGSLAAQAFLAGNDGLRPLEARHEVSDQGAVRIEGRLDEQAPPGDWTLWLVVGRRGELPNPAVLHPVPGSAVRRSRHWVAVGVELRIRSRPP